MRTCRFQNSDLYLEDLWIGLYICPLSCIGLLIGLGPFIGGRGGFFAMALTFRQFHSGTTCTENECLIHDPVLSEAALPPLLPLPPVPAFWAPRSPLLFRSSGSPLAGKCTFFQVWRSVNTPDPSEVVFPSGFVSSPDPLSLLETPIG